jgi:hypothetical protein
MKVQKTIQGSVVQVFDTNRGFESQEFRPGVLFENGVYDGRGKPASPKLMEFGGRKAELPVVLVQPIDLVLVLWGEQSGVVSLTLNKVIATTRFGSLINAGNLPVVNLVPAEVEGWLGSEGTWDDIPPLLANNLELVQVPRIIISEEEEEVEEAIEPEDPNDGQEPMIVTEGDPDEPGGS